mmetsp:Transcript_30222/g.32940  ORF Transcript_30222/g.32940 Transcript_30222/m.32940 type:complete len:94 (+) Transcript_30222:1118-1399(+)
MSLRTSFPQGRCLDLTKHRNKIHQQYLMRGDSQQPKNPYFITKLEKKGCHVKKGSYQANPSKEIFSTPSFFMKFTVDPTIGLTFPVYQSLKIN